jgi:hypothetical protein
MVNFRNIHKIAHTKKIKIKYCAIITHFNKSKHEPVKKVGSDYNFQGLKSTVELLPQ